jgi:hypothetical protein
MFASSISISYKEIINASKVLTSIIKYIITYYKILILEFSHDYWERIQKKQSTQPLRAGISGVKAPKA